VNRLIFFDHLRLGKLIHGLRTRKPIKIVANHLLVFQLTNEDLVEYLARPSVGFSPP
jgi:hypothetical protein